MLKMLRNPEGWPFAFFCVCVDVCICVYVCINSLSTISIWMVCNEYSGVFSHLVRCAISVSRITKLSISVHDV